MAVLDVGGNGYYWVDVVLNALLIVAFVLFAIKLPSIIYVPLSNEGSLFSIFC